MQQYYADGQLLSRRRTIERPRRGYRLPEAPSLFSPISQSKQILFYSALRQPSLNYITIMIINLCKLNGGRYMEVGEKGKLTALRASAAGRKIDPRFYMAARCAVFMGMGMMMLPPTTVSMPFKILLFILADGWRISSLVAK